MFIFVLLLITESLIVGSFVYRNIYNIILCKIWGFYSGGNSYMIL